MTTKPTDQLYELIQAAGGRGLTDPEIAEASGFTRGHVKELRRALQLAGRLQRTKDPARRGGKGRLLDVWIANDAN
jgi:hypothetical protein